MPDFQLFLSLGWQHIWEGYDHLLFLLALIVQLRSWRDGIFTITAFSLTHTFSMVFVAAGWLSVPEGVVESAIALSIVFSAVMNVVSPENRSQWMVAGAFGFVHGAGFSTHLMSLMTAFDSALEIIPVLAGFLTGLELGQIVFVLIAGLAGYALRFWSLLPAIKVELLRTIAAVGLYLFIVRALGA